MIPVVAQRRLSGSGTQQLETPPGPRLVAASPRALAPWADPDGRNPSFRGAVRATEHEVVADLLAAERRGERPRRQGSKPDTEEDGS